MTRHSPSGILYILIAWLFFTVMTLLTRFASQHVPLSTILLFQNLIGLATVLPWIVKHPLSLLQTSHFRLILFRSLVSLAAIALSFLAVQRTSLVNTMLFNNASPLWIPFALLLWRKIPINHWLWPGLIGGFLGILFILHPGKEIIHFGSLLAICAGMLQSFNMIALRLLSYTERNHTVLFYYFLICSIACLPLSILSWVSPTFLEWLDIGAIGILFALGQWAFVRAFHHAKASLLGPFCYSAVVYSVLIDWAFYGKIPDLLAWTGIVLVCLGGIWALHFNKEPT